MSNTLCINLIKAHPHAQTEHTNLAGLADLSVTRKCDREHTSRHGDVGRGSQGSSHSRMWITFVLTCGFSCTLGRTLCCPHKWGLICPGHGGRGENCRPPATLILLVIPGITDWNPALAFMGRYWILSSETTLFMDLKSKCTSYVTSNM